jgi:hypothetical protein
MHGWGHSLTIDGGRREVADATLEWRAPMIRHKGPVRAGIS